jgi:hypothetical protein
MKIYIDGTMVAEQPYDADITTPTGWFRIGNYPGPSGSPYAFSGMIDEVRVYSRGLGAAEVLDLYNNP